MSFPKFETAALHPEVDNVSRPARVFSCIACTVHIQVTWRMVTPCNPLPTSYGAWPATIRHFHQSISFVPLQILLEQPGSPRNSRVSPLILRILPLWISSAMKKYPLISYPNACDRICLFANTRGHIVVVFAGWLTISLVRICLFILNILSTNHIDSSKYKNILSSS